MNILQAIGQATMEGNQHQAAELTAQALKEGLDFNRIIQEGFIPAMALVGQEFAAGTRYIPEMLIAARAMQKGMEVLKPAMGEAKMEPWGTVLLGTVQGDMHDIGKNLFGMMMEGSGLQVIDLGVDVAPGAFVRAAIEHQPGFIALSALLTTTMTAMQSTLDALKEAGLRDRIKVLVGGAPVTQEFADRIGADGYGSNAHEGVQVMKRLAG